MKLPCHGRVPKSRLRRNVSRWALNVFAEGDSMASLGSLSVPCLPQCKDHFAQLRWSFLCFTSWPLVLVLSLGIAEESGAILLTATFEIFYILVRSSLTLLRTKQARLPQSLSSLERCLRPQTIFMLICWILSFSSLSF